MTSIITLGTFAVNPLQRKLFIDGKLAQDWLTQYPEIFDEDDLRLTKTQPRNHFYEWLSAIIIYHSLGYLSLIEKYQYTKTTHHRKQAILTQLNSTTLNNAIAYRGEYGNIQCPDLLVYAPDFSDWFFCESKGGRDKLSKKQELHFKALHELTGKPVHLIQFYFLGKKPTVLLIRSDKRISV